MYLPVFCKGKAKRRRNAFRIARIFNDGFVKNRRYKPTIFELLNPFASFISPLPQKVCCAILFGVPILSASLKLLKRLYSFCAYLNQILDLIQINTIKCECVALNYSLFIIHHSLFSCHQATKFYFAGLVEPRKVEMSHRKRWLI